MVTDFDPVFNENADSKRQTLNAYHLAGCKMVALDGNTKKPIHREWQKRDLTLEGAIAWVEAGGSIGLQMGDVSGGLAAVDLDSPEARKLAPHFLPETLTAGKGEEGPSHYVYRSTGASFARINDVDLSEVGSLKASSNGAGHQIAVEPSIHARKGPYKWTGGFDPNRVTDLSPEDLRRRFGWTMGAALIAKHLPAGGRHDYALSLAGFMLRNGENPETVEKLLKHAWSIVPGALDMEAERDLEGIVRDTAGRLRRDEPATGGKTLNEMVPLLPDRLAKAFKWRSADQAEGRRDYPHADTGNAERFVEEHGRNVRYVPRWGKHLIWTGKVWAVDERAEVLKMARTTARNIHKDAAKEPDPKRQQEISKWALQSQNEGRIRSMIALAAPDIAVTAAELGGDPWLLNCQNGTVDLRSGELREHRREDMLIKRTPTEYEPDASAPVFDAFMERIIPSADLRAFVQRALGSTLVGVVLEQILLIFHGTGANGKTTLVNAVMEALGDYAIQSAPELLMSKGHSHPTELADLYGARFVACMETEEGRRFNESLVKQLTGRDNIKARRMREDFWEFAPSHTVVLGTNHRPEVRGTDHAIWRRLKLVPFSVTIPEVEKDATLPDKLQGELPGILRWLVEGCLAWQRDGLQEPDEVKAATSEYRADMDVLELFLEDRCVVYTAAQAPATPLYKQYQIWCDNNGERSLSQRMFGQRLAERGFTSFKFKSGTHKDLKGWAGIGLRSGDDDPDDDKIRPKGGISGQSRSANRGSSAPLSAHSSAGESPIDKPNSPPEGKDSGQSGPNSGINSSEPPRVEGNEETPSALSALSAPHPTDTDKPLDACPHEVPGGCWICDEKYRAEDAEDIL